MAAAGFNYTCEVMGGTLTIALVYSFASVSYNFVGPKRKDGTPHLPKTQSWTTFTNLCQGA